MTPYKDRSNPEVLVLFDVDGTLTPAREVISPEMKCLLEKARKIFVIGYVGGSDLKKQKEQLGPDCLEMFDYCFSENGILAFKDGVLIHSKNFVEYLGEEKYVKLCNIILEKLSQIELPFKRGVFVELRTGLLNVAPPGRSCSGKERDAFEEYDLRKLKRFRMIAQKYKIRENLVTELEKLLGNYNLSYSLGGQISIDIFPKGWDKTYCLRHVEKEKFTEIHFFGNKYLKGENDYEMITHESVIGHKVDSPSCTMAGLKSLIDKFSTTPSSCSSPPHPVSGPK